MISKSQRQPGPTWFLLALALHWGCAKSPSPREKTPQPAKAERAAAASPQTGAVPEQRRSNEAATRSASPSPVPSEVLGKGDEPSGGGTTASATSSQPPSEFDGTRRPADAGEALAVSSAELKRSQAAETSEDLPAAVRHAARALQAAAAFPRDPKCAALADAARGRLQYLEGKGVTRTELSRDGSLDGRKIIESP